MSLKQAIKLAIGTPLLLIGRKLGYAIDYAERAELLRQCQSCSSDLAIARPFDIRGREYISIGSDVYIGPGVLMLADKGAEIRIGNTIMFGPRVRLIASDHRFDLQGQPIKHSGYRVSPGPISIEDDVWIGAGATVLKGVRIGKGAVVGAGAVVTRDIPACEIWAGNPARKLRDRFAPAQTTSAKAE